MGSGERPVAAPGWPPALQARNPATPLMASVVVRSMNRLSHVAALVDHLLRQDYPDFEVVIVDQSTGEGDRHRKLLAEHEDPRIRYFHREPLGPAGAANAGLQLSRGEVALFIDDDDWPVGDGWISAHMKNYADPHCIGVNGLMLYPECNRARPAKSEGEERKRFRQMLTHGFFKQPNGYAYLPRRKKGIDYLMGGNSSLRRARALELGGWDCRVDHHQEQSLFLKFARKTRAGEFLAYDPSPRYEVRMDVPGGLERRSSRSLVWRVDQAALYFLRVVGRYHPLRVYGLFPLFLVFFLARAGNETWWHRHCCFCQHSDDGLGGFGRRFDSSGMDHQRVLAD